MLRRNGRILLGRRQGAHGAGCFAWPGGGLDFGETLEDAARREVLEETGLLVESLRLICVSNIRQYGRHYVDFEFEAVEFEGDPQNLIGSYTEDWRWYDENDLPSPMFAPCANAVCSLKSGQFIFDE